uniref:Uncharacterized protein n=1 Tax=Panagrolaimus sp. JU765 TaxID=591449 RepID=A0AC34Q2S5_9BILA
MKTELLQTLLSLRQGKISSLAQQVRQRDMTTVGTDAENPEIKKMGFWSNFDPAFPTTAISMGANFILSNMFVFGLTGNAKLAYLAGVLTIPVSLISCVSAASEDFEKWKKMRHLREKGMPVKLMPYPYKFDWADYEIRKKQRELEKHITDAG